MYNTGIIDSMRSDHIKEDMIISRIVIISVDCKTSRDLRIDRDAFLSEDRSRVELYKYIQYLMS